MSKASYETFASVFGPHHVIIRFWVIFYIFLLHHILIIFFRKCPNNNRYEPSECFRNGSYSRGSMNHGADRHCDLTDARCQAMAYTMTLERHWESDAHARRPNLLSATARHNACLIYPHSCIRVMVPNSPQMAWVDPGEGTFTCQVNRSTNDYFRLVLMNSIDIA